MRINTVAIIFCWLVITQPTSGYGATPPTVEELSNALTPHRVEKPTARSIGLGVAKKSVVKAPVKVVQTNKTKLSPPPSVDQSKKLIHTARATSVNSPSIAMRLEFDLNSANLTRSDTEVLDNLGKSLERTTLRGYIYELEGHTCDLGTEEHNLELSRERALKVRDYLVKNFKIHEQQLKVTWFGESRPAVLNNDEVGRSQNRRVVVVNTLEIFELPIVDNEAIVMEVKYSQNGNERNLTDGEILQSNQQYVVKFKTNEDLYVYLYQIDSTGEPIILFPNRDFGSGTNPVVSGTAQRVPELGKWFYLDKVVGEEQIILAASKESIEDPISEFKKASKGMSGNLLLSQTESVYPKTRGLGGMTKQKTYTSNNLERSISTTGKTEESHVFILQKRFLHR